MLCYDIPGWCGLPCVAPLEEFLPRLEGCRAVGNKTSVEVDNSKELLQLASCWQGRKVLDRLNFRGKRTDSLVVMSQELQLSYTKLALGSVDDDPVGLETFENSLEVLFVFGGRGARVQRRRCLPQRAPRLRSWQKDFLPS